MLQLQKLAVLLKITLLNEGLGMKSFEAYVRINSSGLIIKTVVMAESSQAAFYLLQGQYGSNNVVHLPQEIQ